MKKIMVIAAVTIGLIFTTVAMSGGKNLGPGIKMQLKKIYNSIISLDGQLNAENETRKAVDQQLQAKISQIVDVHLDSLGYVSNCLEVRALAAGTFLQLSDALDNWPSNVNVQLFDWVEYYLDEEKGEIFSNEQTATLNAEELTGLIAEIESLAECKRNIARGLNKPFSNSEMKESQFFEMLSSVLRTQNAIWRSLGEGGEHL